MHPSALLLIMVVAAGTAMVHGHRPTAAHTPAALFWEKAMPGTRMPDAIAHLVQRGIDHSPLVEHYTASPSANNVCIIYDVVCNLRSMSSSGAGHLFFHEAQLRRGSTMTASFPAEPESAILPHDVADKVPFTNLLDVLAAFNIPAGSGEAAEVSDTLRRCQAPSPLTGGEPKACATSLEATVRSAMDMLGATNGGGAWAAASALPRSGLPLQPYEVEEVTLLAGAGDLYVACHKMPFPYAVYHCHVTGVSTKAYKVSLRGRAAAAMVLVAVCHHDTSRWNPAHPAFEVLHTRPGGAPVCHLMPYANLVFGKKAEGTAIF
ncbi:unnamed protein product [Urochloa decumbens]|uniref:BURP domain-containing protein n=1 Tax=Urochloa decumbens TaxID=240449 RepID=A0ABC8VWQ6_9POAL